MSAHTLKRHFFSTRDAGGRRRLRLVRVVSVPEALVKLAAVWLFAGKCFREVGACALVLAALGFVLWLLMLGAGLAALRLF